MESSLAHKQSEYLEPDGCDAFLVNIRKALTKITCIREPSLPRKEPLPGDAVCAIGTCVAAMTQMRILVMRDFIHHGHVWMKLAMCRGSGNLSAAGRCQWWPLLVILK